ncbi:MAG: prepilin-type N-terminal cleavage/methylation domain-containing protein [Candidatus Accumulibacter sp.]|nr:prepilin-type N-terminal cleavage/methylation domain-containing protein [Accumulibacter sp.]
MNRRPKEFTLAEVLLVVAIIGILATIALPQLTEITKRGEDKAALSDVRNLRLMASAAVQSR